MLTGIFMCVNLPEMMGCQRAPGCFTTPEHVGMGNSEAFASFQQNSLAVTHAWFTFTKC